MSGSFGKDFRRFFLRGLAAVLPAILTVAILIWVFTLIQKYIGKHMNTAIQWVVVQFLAIVARMPFKWLGADDVWVSVRQLWSEYYLGWVGFLLAFVAIYVIGRFVASFIGRSIWSALEQALTRAPVIKQIYPSAKQVTDFLLSRHKVEYSRVVAVEYPRKGIWSIGLVTSSGMRTLHDKVGPNLLTVFIPSSPTPVTGYTITVRREDVIDLPVNIDEALRFTVSAGVLVPPSERLTEKRDLPVTQGVLTQPEKTVPPEGAGPNGDPDGSGEEQKEQQNVYQVNETAKREKSS